MLYILLLLASLGFSDTCNFCIRLRILKSLVVTFFYSIWFNFILSSGKSPCKVRTEGHKIKGSASVLEAARTLPVSTFVPLQFIAYTVLRMSRGKKKKIIIFCFPNGFPLYIKYTILTMIYKGLEDLAPDCISESLFYFSLPLSLHSS